MKRAREKRRRISVECVGKQERRSKYKAAKENERPTAAALQGGRTKKETARGGKSGKRNGSGAAAAGSLLIFDFSIPSPDDIVIAKQKFEKGYMPDWSDEVYTVQSVSKGRNKTSLTHIS